MVYGHLKWVRFIISLYCLLTMSPTILKVPINRWCMVLTSTIKLDYIKSFCFHKLEKSYIKSSVYGDKLDLNRKDFVFKSPMELVFLFSFDETFFTISCTYIPRNPSISWIIHTLKWCLGHLWSIKVMANRLLHVNWHYFVGI